MLRRPLAGSVPVVEVRNEPDHVQHYENRLVRVYRATIKPGAKTLYHRHTEDTVYLVIQGGVIGTRLAGTRNCPMTFPPSYGILRKAGWGVRLLLTGMVRMPDGFFFVMRHKAHPVVHCASASTRNRHGMVMLGVELKSSLSDSLKLQKGERKQGVEYKTAQYGLSRRSLRPGETFDVSGDHLPCLIVMPGMNHIHRMDGAETRAIGGRSNGNFIWCEGGQGVSLVNTGTRDAGVFIIMGMLGARQKMNWLRDRW